MSRRLSRSSNQRGFTIIELMIATTVLSVILLLVTTMMISIGNLFYKGVNQSRIQDNVSNIADEISQRLELSGTIPNLGTDATNPAIKVYCLGDRRYSFIRNVQIGTVSGGKTYNQILWRDVPSSCSVNQGADLTDPNLSADDSANQGIELIAPNSRLTSFSISTISPYTITVSVAYGETSLLNLAGFNTTCKLNLGDQFCATARLTTNVANRL
jgi:prepilin-type N-terminal cleavage/methylation domain-containing protein